MRRGTRLGVLVGLPVLLVAVGAVLFALVWLQQRSDNSIQQALIDARQTGSSPDQASAAARRYMADLKNVVVSPT